MDTAPSSSGPGRDPFKVEIAGSNPAGATFSAQAHSRESFH